MRRASSSYLDLIETIKSTQGSILCSLAAPGTGLGIWAGILMNVCDISDAGYNGGVKESVDWGTLFAQGLILHQGWDYHGYTLGHSMSFWLSFFISSNGLAGHIHYIVLATLEVGEVDSQWLEAVGDTLKLEWCSLQGVWKLAVNGYVRG